MNVIKCILNVYKSNRQFRYTALLFDMFNDFYNQT